MLLRYTAHGAMAQAADGACVAATDYNALDSTFHRLLLTAQTLCKQIEAGELSSADADAALFTYSTPARS